MSSSAGYDAFLSYSHSQDDWLAPVLQAGLERFATPWYRARSLRLFRDVGSLAANPELWDSIVAALRASRWLILLASPDAARSSWVNDEVQWWLTHKSADRLLVVATAEPLHWDTAVGDWAADSPVPPALRGAFRAEPFWIDLTGVRASAQPGRVPGMQLAALAAPLRGTAPDALAGEHVRQRRRTLLMVRSVIVTLSALLLLAVSAIFFGLHQLNAVRNANRITTARELAALSESLLGSQLDVAQLLAVGAYQTDRDPQTEAALLQAAAASPRLVRYLQADSVITVLASAADGRALVAGTTRGTLDWFDPRSGRSASVRTTLGSITVVSVSANGQVVAATDGTRTVSWTAGAPRTVPVTGVRSPASVAVSPSGRQIAVLGEANPPHAGEVLLVHTAGEKDRTAAVSGSFLPGATGTIGFAAESSIALVSGASNWVRFDSRNLQVTASSNTLKTPGDSYLPGNAENGAYAGFTKADFISVWPTSGTGAYSTFRSAAVPDEPESFLAIRGDGREAAVIQSGTISVVPLASGKASSSAPAAAQLTANSDTSTVTFLGTQGELASAGGNLIAVWDPAQVSRLEKATGFSVPFDGMVGLPPALLAPPDGKWLELAAGGGYGLWLFPDGHGPVRPSPPAAGDGVPVRSGDTPMVVSDGVSSAGDSALVTLSTADGKKSWSWRDRYLTPGFGQAPGLETAGMLPGGKQFAAVFSDGDVQVFDTATGSIRQLRPGSPNVAVLAHEAAVSPDGRGAVISEWTNDSTPLRPQRVVYVDLRSGATRELGSGGADGVTFSSAGLVIDREPGALEVWDTAGQRMLREFAGAGGAAGPLAVSPDGTLLARLSDDGVASVTDLTTGALLADFSLPAPDEGDDDPWFGTDMRFAADGRSLLTATSGGKLIRWTLYEPDLMRSICDDVGHTLTAAEWDQYTGTPAPARMPCAP
jgi:WD40 repeat protein